MPVRSAHARWEGPLVAGKGSVDTGSGALSADCWFKSRFDDGGAIKAARPLSKALGAVPITLEAKLVS